VVRLHLELTVLADKLQSSLLELTDGLGLLLDRVAPLKPLLLQLHVLPIELGILNRELTDLGLLLLIRELGLRELLLLSVLLLFEVRQFIG